MYKSLNFVWCKTWNETVHVHHSFNGFVYCWAHPKAQAMGLYGTYSSPFPSPQLVYETKLIKPFILL